MSKPESVVQPSPQAVTFCRALVIGIARVACIMALTVAATQALYAMGWGYATLMYSWGSWDTEPPPSIWIGAAGASPKYMLSAGVFSLFMLAAMVAVVGLLAHVGGWRGWERWFQHKPGRVDIIDREIS